MSEDRPTVTDVYRLLQTMDGRLTAVEGRLDHIGLNGHAEAIKTLADATPALLRIVQRADPLTEIADERVETEKMWAGIRRRVGWTRGTGTAVRLLFAAVTAAAALVILQHLFPLPPIP